MTTEKSSWAGLAEVLESSLMMHVASHSLDGTSGAPELMLKKPFGMPRPRSERNPRNSLEKSPPDFRPTPTAGKFGDLDSARIFVLPGLGWGGARAAGEEMAAVVPRVVAPPIQLSNANSRSMIHSPPANSGISNSSSRSGLLPGAVRHSRDPRWQKCELSQAYLSLGRKSTRKRAKLPDPRLEAVGLQDIDPGQIEFVKGLFGSCLPTPSERKSEFARHERERQQIANAEHEGMRVAQRIARRRQLLEEFEGDGGLSAASLGPSNDFPTEKLEAVTEEEKPLSLLACESPKSPQQEKKSGGASRLHKDRCDRLMKVDRLRRISLKPSSSAGNFAGESNFVTSPRGRLRVGDLPSLDSSIGSDGGPRRRAFLDPPGDRRLDVLQVAFCRYDPDNTGILDAMDVRSATHDLGIQPGLKSRQAVYRLMRDAMKGLESKDGIDFGGFEALIPRLRESIQVLLRPDLHECYTNGLDKNGRYDVSNARACLEALGMKVSTDEWQDVQRMFDGFSEAVAYLSSRGRPTPAGQALLRRIAAQSLEALGESTGDVQFELFEALVHQSRERLIAASRATERRLAEELRLTEEEFEEFREDLVELYTLFGQHSHEGQLNMDGVMNLLNACGCEEVQTCLSSEELQSFIFKAKEGASRSASSSSKAADLMHEPDSKLDQPKQETHDQLPSVTESQEEEGEGELPSKPETVLVNLLEFLDVLRQVRRASRERCRSFLLEIFGRYDKDNVGVVAVKDMGKLLRDLKVQPRTRDQQLEMQRIFDEAYEIGEGLVAFPQFELVFQRVCEKIRRAERREEEDYGRELGFQLQHFRRLHQLFERHVAEGTRRLYISGLRKIMTALQREYGSDELFSLFYSFSHPNDGAMDAKGFYKMMHTIEVAKTPGRLQL